MLGELVGEEKGKVISYRVLPAEVGGAQLEVSFRATGNLCGAEHRTTATYVSTMTPNGTVFGDGRGVVMTKDGDMATWRGQGIGKLKPGGGASWRGAVHYLTASGKLARLLGIAVAFEYEIDENDNTTSKLFEWK